LIICDEASIFCTAVLGNAINYFHIMYKEKESEIFELQKILTEKSIHMIQQQRTAKQRNCAYKVLSDSVEILSSRHLNSYFKYNNEILSVIKKILVYSQAEKKIQNTSFALEKIVFKKCFVKVCMMRGKYDEIVEKLAFLFEEKRFFDKCPSGIYNKNFDFHLFFVFHFFFFFFLKIFVYSFFFSYFYLESVEMV
jgi:superfamily II helicase